MSAELRGTLARSLGPGIVLGDELGGGAMARVFRARDTTLDREIVVKVLAPDLAGEVSVERFRREIVTAARLTHPQVVPVLVAGDADGMPWYTMPFIPGESLQRALDRGERIPRDRAIDILRDVARALGAAHAQGIVHRDIKPGNVLLAGGSAVVTDFGIAKAIDAARTQGDARATATAGLTRAGLALGTPAYMAPEQAAGDAVDARADVYAWGVLAYELLAGHHPFAQHTTSQAVLAAHIAEPAPPLSSGATGVPRPLAAMILRTLAKSPTERPATGEALLAAFDAALGGARSGAVPARSRGEGRSRALAIGAAVVGVTALGALGVRYASGRAGADGGTSSTTARDDGPPIVAVLPFDNAGAVDDSSFADGLGEAITNKLARLGGLRVIDRASVLSLRDQAADPRVVGRELGAQFVLRATVRWAKGADGTSRVQVTPVVVRTADGTTRWSGEPIAATPTDPFAVQATVASQVVDALDIAIAAVEREQLERPPTTDLAANAAYRRGAQLAASFLVSYDPAIGVAATRAFDDAIARDPRFAEAFGAKAEVLLNRAVSGSNIGSATSIDARLLDSTRAMARRALDLDPGEYRASYILAGFFVRAGMADSARSIVDRGIAARPSSGVLQTIRAEQAFWAGDTATARDAIRRALALAPRSPETLEWIPLGAYFLRDSATVRSMIRRHLAVAPGRVQAVQYHMEVAQSLGDSTLIAELWRAYRAAGGTIGPVTMSILRHGTMAMRHELDTLTLASLASPVPTTLVDFHVAKGMRAREIGDRAGALRHFAEAARNDMSIAGGFTLTENDRLLPLARRSWVLALAGDTARARHVADSLTRRLLRGDTNLWPMVRTAAWCRLADTRAALSDRDGVARALEPCLTDVGGLWPDRVRLEPAMRPYLDDPRVAALLRTPVVRPDLVRR